MTFEGRDFEKLKSRHQMGELFQLAFLSAKIAGRKGVLKLLPFRKMKLYPT